MDKETYLDLLQETLVELILEWENTPQLWRVCDQLREALAKVRAKVEDLDA